MKNKILNIGSLIAMGTALTTMISCDNANEVFKYKKIIQPIKKDINVPNVKKNKAKTINKFDMNSFLKKLSSEVTANPSFVQGKVFGKAPKSVKNSDLNVSNLGLDAIEKELKIHNAIISNIKAINSTRDDSTGKMDIILSIKHKNKNYSKIITIKDLLITKDIELDANNFSTIKQIISALDAETSISFAKGIDKMSPQDLKEELIDLQEKLSGGSLTVIGHYRGSTQAISFQKRRILTNLINAFGDVSKKPRLVASAWNPFGNSLGSAVAIKNILFAIGGNILSLFAEYGSDIISTGSQADAVNLIGSLPTKVIKMFPDLLNMFKTVAGLVKEMDIVKQWAKDHNKIKDLKNIDHTLVQFVLTSGK